MQVGDNVSFGCYDWRVLDLQNEAAFLITESIVEQRAYHDARQDITWADCALRSYLNGVFLGRFTEQDQARILPASNRTHSNAWYGTDGGADTLDRIFLLSVEDVVCRYFGDSSAKLYDPGKNQKYWFQRKDVNNRLRMATFKGKEWWWWLRTPGRHGRSAAYVHGDGNIGIQGNGTFHYNSNIIHPMGDNTGGVRPALWLKIS